MRLVQKLNAREQGVNIDIGSCPYDGWDWTYFRIHFEGVENRVAKAAGESEVKNGER